MRLFEVLHEDCNDNIYQDKLRHEYEDDEEKRREVGRDAAVPQTVIAFLALFTQSVLHDAVPVVAGGDPEQSQECHAKRPEVGVLAQALAGVVLVALWKTRKVCLILVQFILL